MTSFFSQVTCQIGVQELEFANVPRRLTQLLGAKLSARVLGGFTLLVLASVPNVTDFDDNFA